MDLTDLRTEIDRIDDALHDLIMRRAAVVQQVAARKTGPTRLRPGREATILRRLLARHSGALPPVTITRIWRELLAGALAVQGDFVVAIGGVALDLAQAAREQFGALVRLHAYVQPDAALDAVRAGQASIAVLPLPASENPWWPSLLANPRLHVVARLPFWAARPDGAPLLQAFAVSAAPPDPSGDDRTLLAFRSPPPNLPAMLHASGLDAYPLTLHDELALADVAGFLTDADPRVAALSAASAAPSVLGAYACPISTGSPP